MSQRRGTLDVPMLASAPEKDLVLPKPSPPIATRRSGGHRAKGDGPAHVVRPEGLVGLSLFDEARGSRGTGPRRAMQRAGGKTRLPRAPRPRRSGAALLACFRRQNLWPRHPPRGGHDFLKVDPAHGRGGDATPRVVGAPLTYGGEKTLRGKGGRPHQRVLGPSADEEQRPPPFCRSWRHRGLGTLREIECSCACCGTRMVGGYCEVFIPKMQGDEKIIICPSMGGGRYHMSFGPKVCFRVIQGFLV
ncbi:hypothetical protein GWK47_033433 [Chionoecetes opilio]|uniref:Uncharacterized protein n=1 Tax=Chionoecetes opilio TaxID=41210 RepID=A0A8J4YX20_CHIOP|nr:hypothetical protein GWK47_033433 [Chionoecetes opilio]